MSLIEALFERIDGAVDQLFSPLMRLAGEDNADGRGTTGTGVEHNSDGSITVNGVVVPKLVADQLKNMGVSVSFLNAGQIAAAVKACAVDSTLVDDPNGTDFFDDLELDESEKEHQKEKEDDEQERAEKEAQEHEEREDLEDELTKRNMLLGGRGNLFTEPAEATGSIRQFRDRIKDEREQQRERRRRRQQLKDEGAAEQAPPVMQAGV